MAEREIAAGARQAGVGTSPDPGVRRQELNVALAVVILLVCVFAIFWKTTLSMVAIWERSETFAHGFVVIPIFCYLLWQRRHALAGLEPTPCWGALLGIAAAGAVWLLGEIVSAASVSQFAMVAMVPFAVWAVLGTRIAMALGIPLAFLFFAVPFGEFLVPTMIDRTADFTVAALRLSGVPVYREGNYFVIPSGAWSVVDACSGLRYLIASVMVGCLYAYLMYRSVLRRALLIAAAFIVPILANWVRAYLIVMIGHLSSNRLAVGVDHLIYGWLFFGVVIALLFWIGARWRQDDLPVPAHSNSRLAIDDGPAGHSLRRVWAPALAAIVLMVMWQPLGAHFDTSESTRPVRLAPLASQDGWTPTSEEVSAWKPDLSGFRAELRQSFAKGDQRVALVVSFFRDQTAETKAISSTNQVVNTTNRIWRRIDIVGTPLQLGGSTVVPREATLVGPGPLERLEAIQWYWVDGHVTSKDYEAKLYQAMSVLRGHGDSVAWVIVYAPAGQGVAQASQNVRRFAMAMGRSLDGMLREAATQ